MSTAATESTEQSAKKFLAAAVGGATIGVTPAPAPQLNGLLLQLPGASPVYLVINGFRCWVPDPTTYNNLFVGGATVVSDLGVGAVSEGAALTSGAILAQGNASPQVYLVSNGVKMWIPSPDIFARYQFNAAQIQVLPQIVIDFIPNGPSLNGPTS